VPGQGKDEFTWYVPPESAELHKSLPDPLNWALQIVMMQSQMFGEWYSKFARSLKKGYPNVPGRDEYLRQLLRAIAYVLDPETYELHNRDTAGERLKRVSDLVSKEVGDEFFQKSYELTRNTTGVRVARR
jgi:hypothetical protein